MSKRRPNRAASNQQGDLLGAELGMNNCKTCRCATAKAAHERMHRAGFANCALLPDWHYVSSVSTCRFNPVTWSQKS
ncbi:MULTISPECIES: hypothetical protein [unclassified Caballeronia]|uniref:hypothetical protein n=1 Tax=unclassified Caballeronia TaxID=2646786 RepID=UPI00285E942A|nr:MULTISPECIES: hypothetical protein [unclassified Caballeronia]MDR5776545.1 hypothetical protein [Caballeronia sp. LZ002]MDR5851978.1 hypothetical protein [Caballeronia sp. LZ003]